jgi:hypothetical protein
MRAEIPKRILCMWYIYARLPSGRIPIGWPDCWPKQKNTLFHFETEPFENPLKSVPCLVP